MSHHPEEVIIVLIIMTATTMMTITMITSINKSLYILYAHDLLLFFNIYFIAVKFCLLSYYC